MRAKSAFALWVAGAVAVTLALAVPAAPQTEASPAYRDVGLFAAKIVRLIGGGRYDVAWRNLHPAHQRTVSLSSYTACELQSPMPAVDAVKVVAVNVASVHVPGLANPEPGYAVRLRTKFVAPAMSPVFVRHTVHVVPIARRYSWILPPSRYEGYILGRCP